MGESTGGGAESAWWSDPKACRKIDLIEPPPKKKKWVRNGEAGANQDVSVDELAKVKPEYPTTWPWSGSWDRTLGRTPIPTGEMSSWRRQRKKLHPSRAEWVDQGCPSH